MRANTLILLFSLSLIASAQNYRFSTVAGFGLFGGDGGAAVSALVNPSAVAVAADGTLYVSDPNNYRIRKIDRAGNITTLIGTGSSVFTGDGVAATTAGMSSSYSLALDASGNLYFTDEGNLRVREVTAAGVVKTIAGNGSCGTVTAGIAAVTAPLCDVEGVTVDSQGRVYFGSNSQVWRVNLDASLTLVAGTGVYGNSGDGGLATAAKLAYPASLVVDQNGNLYIGDIFSSAIRKVAASDQRISTVVTISDNSASTIQLALDASGSLFYVTGTTRVFKLVSAGSDVVGTVLAPNDASYLSVDASGAFFLCSLNTQRLLKLANSTVSTVAGAYPYLLDGTTSATSAKLHLNPLLIGLAVDSTNNVYFPELAGDLTQRIAKVTPGGVLSTLSAPAKLPTNGAFTVQAVVIGPGGAVYFSNFTQVYRLESNGLVTLIAGAPGFPSNIGDGALAINARLSNPSSLAFDPAGNLYITEPFDSRVRKVNTSGIITTFAGFGGAGYSGDGGQASSAKLSTPVDVKVDGQGNVYIADLTASVVRKVNTNGVITTVAGNGTKGFSGDGGQAVKAQISGAAAIAIDPSGNLFIADRPSAASTISPATDNNRIRMVTPAGIISTIAGPTQGYNGEGITSQVASLGGPVALAADAQGNIYVNESSTQRIRKLTLVPGGSSVVISAVNTAFGNAEISQNGWIEVKGKNLAPASAEAGVLWTDAPEFLQGKMPTQLSGVSVTVNGKPAFIYFVSPGQINALCPMDSVTGDVSVVVTNNGVSSALFTVKERTASPSFLRFGATTYIAATHADVNASLLGPASMSVPGYIFTPAKPGEIVVLYSVGFGTLTTALTNGASSQYGTLPPQPVVQIDGRNAEILYSGINGPPGLYQFNVVVPLATRDGDVDVVVTHGGNTTPVSTIAVHH